MVKQILLYYRLLPESYTEQLAVADKMKVKIITVQNIIASAKQLLGYLLYMSCPVPVKEHRVTMKPNIYM